MTFFGLPWHPLVVHATVVVVPLAALVLVLSAVSGRFRDWAGWLTPGLAVLALALTPLSTTTGEVLRDATFEPGFDHQEYGEMLLWFTLPMALLAVVAHVLRRRGSGPAGIVGILAALVGVAAIGMVGVIGHTGASSAWCGKSPDFTQCEQADDGGGEG